MTRRYLEDFAVGQVFASGRLRVDKKETYFRGTIRNLTVPRRPMAVLRRCAAVLVSREVPRDAEQVLRAGAGLVFSVPVKAHSWSARAKRQPKVTRRTHLFEP